MSPSSQAYQNAFSLRVQTSGLTRASKARTFSFPGRKQHLGTVRKRGFRPFLIQQSVCHFPFPSHLFLSYLLSSPAYLFPSRKKEKVALEKSWVGGPSHLHTAFIARALHPECLTSSSLGGGLEWGCQWGPESSGQSH